MRLFGTLALAVVALGVSPGRADHEPVIPVPGRADAPVIVGCCDATGAVVYGDFGLYRPGHMAPFVEGGVMAAPDRAPAAYYPSAGVKPKLGRHEVEPPLRRRPASLDYQRSWFSGSRSGPVTEYPPFNPPQVIVAPPASPRRKKP